MSEYPGHQLTAITGRDTISPEWRLMSFEVDSQTR